MLTGMGYNPEALNLIAQQKGGEALIDSNPSADTLERAYEATKKNNYLVSIRNMGYRVKPDPSQSVDDLARFYDSAETYYLIKKVMGKGLDSSVRTASQAMKTLSPQERRALTVLKQKRTMTFPPLKIKKAASMFPSMAESRASLSRSKSSSSVESRGSLSRSNSSSEQDAPRVYGELTMNQEAIDYVNSNPQLGELNYALAIANPGVDISGYEEGLINNLFALAQEILNTYDKKSQDAILDDYGVLGRSEAVFLVILAYPPVYMFGVEDYPVNRVVNYTAYDFSEAGRSTVADMETQSGAEINLFREYMYEIATDPRYNNQAAIDAFKNAIPYDKFTVEQALGVQDALDAAQP
jgi:hypothetical protein